MRHLANLALTEMKGKIPVIFDDIFGYYENAKIENCEIINSKECGKNSIFKKL